MTETFRVGVVGARGHTGAELLRILARHPQVEVALAGSRELEGEPVPAGEGLLFESVGPDHIAERDLDAVFLALPDGVGAPWTDAIPADTVIVDISADHRFDDTWVYGLPELHREKIAGARRIANPGCYATALQLAIAPFVDDLEGTPTVFGVSGYSGAGTTPSPRNDPVNLRDNLIPYRLTGHNHEREGTRHLGHPVRLMPHVHPTFRGLLVTAHMPLREPTTRDKAHARLLNAYEREPLVEAQDDIPTLRDGSELVGVLIGGTTVSEDGVGLTVVAVEDNLLKGAAVQAVQNLNLALGLAETAGIS
ncbi:MAG TPA: N-acetyl-gamma-glutamyl-phosphate reductase [Acidimicrobiia bacterium]|nr:N-acetyl-gamma-glutamyl-phosphate reductase [Acidimicrobiia bacterium]